MTNLLKAKEINEDDDRKYQDLIQKMTDKNIAEIDKVFSAKEKDLMSI